MPDLLSSPVHRALAAELRRLRELTGMPGDEVAARLKWSASKVSRIETHHSAVKQRDLDRLLDLYGVDDARRAQLAALAAEPEPRGWWNAYTDSIDSEYISYIAVEESASKVLCMSPELVHGLLQTEAYASAIMDVAYGSPPSIPPRMIRDRIDIRLRRQQLLGSPGRKFTFVLDEATLLRRHGSAEVMRRQLAHIEQTSRLHGVTIRVLALDGNHPAANPGAFAILVFEPVHDTTVSDMVYRERLLASELVEEEAVTHGYRLAFERLSAAALDPDASRELIARTAAERWS